MLTQSLAGRIRAEAEGQESECPKPQQQLQPSPRSKGKQGTQGTLLTMDGEMILTAPLLSCTYTAFLPVFNYESKTTHTKKTKQNKKSKTNKQTTFKKKSPPRIN